MAGADLGAEGVEAGAVGGCEGSGEQSGEVVRLAAAFGARQGEDVSRGGYCPEKACMP